MPSESFEVPAEYLSGWQNLVNVAADLADVPAGLIMKTSWPKHSVLVRSDREDNPYYLGQTFEMNPQLYCHGVYKNDGELVVENASEDPHWCANDDLEFGMTFYVGYPVKWPDGGFFGTICLLDREKNEMALRLRKCLQEFVHIIEADLRLLREMEVRRKVEEQLRESHDELESRVEVRTRELWDANNALKILLKNAEEKGAEYELLIMQQIESQVMPIMHQLKKQANGYGNMATLLDQLSNELSQVTGQVSQKQTQFKSRLSPIEYEVAVMIMRGKSTREIAEALSREQKTIVFHCNNIVRKLGLEKGNKSLSSQLWSYDA